MTSLQTPASGPQIGMDIGGTKIAAAVLDEQGRVAASKTVPTEKGIEGVLGTATRLASELAASTGHELGDFVSLGVGVPGQVDRAQGILRHSYNIGIDELALGPELTARTGIPTSIDNDVTAAAIGAVHLMQLGGTIAYLNLGTGLAAGLVVDGRALRGSTGATGEIGHIPMDELQRQCPCGQRGCLETIASGIALKTYWPAGGDHPGRVLIGAMADGDQDARDAFALLVRGAASAVRLLGLSFDPDTVVIGGGLRLLGAPLTDGIRSTLETWEQESRFFGQLGMSRRLRMLPEDSPAAAVGAALAPRS